MRRCSTSDDQAMAMNTARLLAADAGRSDTEDHSGGYRKHQFGMMGMVICQRITPLGRLQG
jgi:hypothetical protein